MPAGNAYPSGYLVPSPIVGLACAPIVETRFLKLAMSLLDFSPRIPLCTFSNLLLRSILLRTSVQIWCKSIQDYVSQGITHPVFYGDLVYKLRRAKGEVNFISSGSKIVKRLRIRLWHAKVTKSRETRFYSLKLEFALDKLGLLRVN